MEEKETIVCDHCSGNGAIAGLEEPCWECSGVGRLPKDRPVVYNGNIIG